MKILLIPEDFRKDQYIIRPILRAMLKRLHKAQARITVCTDPLLTGVSQAADWSRLEEIIDMYPMVDLFVLLVDRDGQAGRRSMLDSIEKKATAKLGKRRRFLAENAWQELEVWLLAGHNLPKSWKWQEVRAEVHPKEVYYLPFAQARGLIDAPAEGRKTLAEEAARRYAKIRSRCPDDVAGLEARIASLPA
jgi:hypothetical protein